MPQLSPFSLPGRFWRGNLHTHSTLSDGALEPLQVIEAYKNAGYDFMMLSDHFIGNYNWPIADTRALRSNNFTTIIGSELHAPQTQAGELWHIVAAGLPLDFPPASKSETGEQLARRAHEAGAFIGIAHPAWSQLTIEDGRAIDEALKEAARDARRFHKAMGNPMATWVDGHVVLVQPENIVVDDEAAPTAKPDD